ncbi:hypothetical protein ACFLZZ_04235 [Nanoarchaeota archaeon]
MEVCEHCLENEAKFDGLLNGEYKRLCNNCVVLDGAVTLAGKSNVDISKVIARRTVKEILMNMSGIAKPALKKQEVHLDDLRRVKKDKEHEEKNFDNQLKHINDPDEPKPWSRWVRGFTPEVKKDKRPSPDGVKLDDVRDGDVLDL